MEARAACNFDALSNSDFLSTVFFADRDGVVTFGAAAVTATAAEPIVGRLLDGVILAEGVPLAFRDRFGVVEDEGAGLATTEDFPSFLGIPLGVDGVSPLAVVFLEEGEANNKSGVFEATLSFCFSFALSWLGEAAEVVSRRLLPDSTLSRQIPLPLTPSRGGAFPRPQDPAHNSGKAWKQNQFRMN